MEKGVGKRGLSPVVASVLLILLVIVLASIIFLWARGFIGEQVEKFGEPIENVCGRVKFDAVRYGDDELEVINKGEVDIRYLDIKMMKDGNSEIGKFERQIDAGKSADGTFVFEMSDGEEPDEIIVYPALIGSIRGGTSNNVFTCMDAGVTI